MNTIILIMTILIGIIFIMLGIKRDKSVFKAIGVLSFALLIFLICLSSINIETTYYAPSKTQIDEFISENSLNVLSVKEADDFTIILYESGSGYGEYTLSVNQDNELITNGVKVAGGSYKEVSIGHVTTGETPYITVIINDKEILKEAEKIEIVLKDGTVLNENIVGKGIIILHKKENDKEQIPIEKLIIYDENMNEIYKNVRS